MLRRYRKLKGDMLLPAAKIEDDTLSADMLRQKLSSSISLYLLLSPFIFLYIPLSSPISRYLPLSPFIFLYLPLSPSISFNLPLSLLAEEKKIFPCRKKVVFLHPVLVPPRGG